MFRGEIFRATAGVQRLAIFSIFRFKQKEADVTKREKLFYFVLKPSACRATTNREPPPPLCVRRRAAGRGVIGGLGHMRWGITVVIISSASLK